MHQYLGSSTSGSHPAAVWQDNEAELLGEETTRATIRSCHLALTVQAELAEEQGRVFSSSSLPEVEPRTFPSARGKLEELQG